MPPGAFVLSGLSQMLAIRDDASDPAAATVPSPYGYVPTKFVCLTMLGLFGTSAGLHTFQSFKYRMWWWLPTATFAMWLEVIGWAGRLWSSLDITEKLAFKIQICFTIIGPTPLLAVNFILLGHFITMLGNQYSRMNAKLYSRIFLTFDIVALTVQGAGAFMAATQDDPTNGGHVMLGGICFQMFGITLFIILASEYFIRYKKNKPHGPSEGTQRSYSIRTSRKGFMTRPMKMVLIALTLNTFCLFIRAIYRVAELVDGFDGYIITHEIYFNTLDATPIVLASFILHVAHPGRLLGPGPPKFSEYEEVGIDLPFNKSVDSFAKRGKYGGSYDSKGRESTEALTAKDFNISALM